MRRAIARDWAASAIEKKNMKVGYHSADPGLDGRITLKKKIVKQ